MTALTRAFRPLRSLAIALALTLAVVRPAAATDWTDIWYNALRSGSGYNFVQSDTAMFVTFFVYDQNRQAIWYSATLFVDSNGVWSGDLYLTNGAYYGGAYSPPAYTKVGAATFTPDTSYAGTLRYNVGTVNVTEPITRQTLTRIRLGGTYFGALTLYWTNCNDASQNGWRGYIYSEIDVSQTTAAATFNLSTSGGSACTLSGNFIQDGQLYRFPSASYTCGSTFSSTANISQVKATAQGIEGQWVAPVGAGCIESTFFSAVLQ